MQVFCPSCGASTAVGEASAQAACAQCGAALPMNMPAYGPPEMGAKPHAFGVQDMAAAGTIKPPATRFVWNEVQSPDGAWMVGMRGAAPGCVLVLGIAFLGATVFAAAQCGSNAGNAEVRATLVGLLAAYFAYKALCGAVNRSTLRMDGDVLAVRRGPIPELGAVRVPTSGISGFDLVRGMTTSSGGTKTVYHVVRAIGVGPPARLPLGMHRREEADFIVRRLTEMLADVQRRFGIAPPPGVAGSPLF
jgi:hypothetical protein